LLADYARQPAVKDVRKRRTEEPIIGFLKQAEASAAVKEPCRQHGVSEESYYLLRSKFGATDVSDAKKLWALEKESARLKKL
jgi:putative transposase